MYKDIKDTVVLTKPIFEMVFNVKVTTPATSGGQPNSTSGAVSSVPGAGGCPSFDFSTCDPNCVVMDDKGCLSCSCAGC